MSTRLNLPARRSRWISRRSFLWGAAAAGGSLAAAPLLRRPALADSALADSGRPAITHGVQSGDMPIGLNVPDAQSWVPKGHWEAWANGDNGVPLGRELELASLFSFIRNNAIRNVVWITADVHYGQAIRYDPSKGSFGDFDPFWEFVAGPINAGTFGPNDLDRSFGPEVKFTAIPADMKPNRPPSDGFQFFGQADIDAASGVMTVSLKDLMGKTVFSQALTPAG